MNSNFFINVLWIKYVLLSLRLHLHEKSDVFDAETEFKLIIIIIIIITFFALGIAIQKFRKTFQKTFRSCTALLLLFGRLFVSTGCATLSFASMFHGFSFLHAPRDTSEPFI